MWGKSCRTHHSVGTPVSALLVRVKSLVLAGQDMALTRTVVPSFCLRSKTLVLETGKATEGRKSAQSSRHQWPGVL